MISKYTKVKLFLFQDIIEKELENSKNFYFIQEGCVEAIKEEEDFMYYDLSLVKAFLKNDYKYFKKKTLKLTNLKNIDYIKYLKLLLKPKKKKYEEQFYSDDEELREEKNDLWANLIK